MIAPAAVDTRYTQQKITVPAGGEVKVDVTFAPDAWVLVPNRSIVTPVFYSPHSSINVRSAGMPMAGSGSSTITGVRGSRTLYLYNSGAVDITFYITATYGLVPPVLSTPTTLSAEGVAGMWQELTDQANIAWNTVSGNAEVTLEGDRNLTNPTGVEQGAQYFLLIKQDVVGGRHLTYDTDYQFAGGAPPTLSFLPFQIDLLEFMADNNGYMYLQRITRNMTDAFSPISLGSMFVWLRADSIAGLSDGDPLATWEDQSGNGYDFIQADPVLRPLWRSPVVNGLPAIQFDGADDDLNEVSVTLNRPFTVYVVCATAAPGSSGRVISIDCGANWLMYDLEGPNWAMYNFANIVGPIPVADQFELMACWQRVTGGSYWHNGNLQGSNANTGSATALRQVLGANHTAYTQHFGGYIAELLIYEVDHTDEQRQLIEEYLRGKYNLW